MKKTVMILFLAVVSLAASAADVTITTGQQGLTYNGVYGVNLAGALSEFGNKVSVVPSKGSLDNLDKVAAGTAQIGFTQADAFMFWRNKHPNEAQSVDIVGELPDECIFVAVKDGGAIDGEDDLKEGVKIAVGDASSGSFASWSYLQSLEKNYAKVQTFAKGGLRSLAKVTTGEYDAFLWVGAKGKSNKFLEAVNQKDSGLHIIDMNDWNMADKLPNGKAVYSVEKAVTQDGFFSDSKVKVPCTKTLVVANVDAGDELLESVSSIMLKNQARIIGDK